MKSPILMIEILQLQINKESIMNRSGDISIPLDESPAASKTVGENNNTVNKSFFIFTEY